MTRAPARRRPPAQSPSADALIALVGGRLDGQWFHPADWDLRRRAAERMAAVHGWQPGRDVQAVALGYRDSGEWVSHPQPVQWPQGGTVWRWHVAADQ